MGCHNRYGSIAVGVYGSHQYGTVLPMTEAYTDPRFNYERREPKVRWDRNNWVSCWPRGKLGGGTAGWGTDGYSPIGAEYNVGQFELFSCDGAGTSLSRFIRGTCVDTSEVAVANATVQVFRTSDDFYLGQDVSRDDGTYIAPADAPLGTQCYLVAYKAGSPDIAGTTVNTLTPTDVAGN